MRGRLIVFEGGEGSGKSTQAALLASQLGAALTREPGGTQVGARIREIVLDPGLAGPLAPWAEALLMAADRAQHVAEVIEPALSAGHDVVTDRYIPSSLAYQGHGRGLDVEELRRLSSAAGAPEPDLVIFLDVPASVAAERLHGRDRLEAAGEDFHARVADGYRQQAAANPDRWIVIDGTGAVDDVAARVREAVDKWLAARS